MRNSRQRHEHGSNNASFTVEVAAREAVVAYHLTDKRTELGPMTTNPYESPRLNQEPHRIEYPNARILKSGFLYRKVEFSRPFEGTLTYDSWWWRQRVQFDGKTLWFRISWRKIHDRIEFLIPGQPELPALIEITFGRNLAILRFKISVRDELIFDEQH